MEDAAARKLIAMVARATRSIEEARVTLAELPRLSEPREVVGADGRTILFPPMPIDFVGMAAAELDDAYRELDRGRQLAHDAGLDIAAFDDVRAQCAAGERHAPRAQVDARRRDAIVCVAALRAAAPHLAWDAATDDELAEARAAASTPPPAARERRSPVLAIVIAAILIAASTVIAIAVTR
jgi:hypothetical protein